MAKYVLTQKRKIFRFFSFSFCADELFLQTIAKQSPLKDNIIGKCSTFTDWERGRPYTFTEEDYELLIHTDRMFARKFDYSKYPKIVDMLNAKIRNEA